MPVEGFAKVRGLKREEIGVLDEEKKPIKSDRIEIVSCLTSLAQNCVTYL
jgi:hypothetical protein